MEKIEDKIRDNLAENLSILDKGLVLLDKESFLPNPNGTRSFVDLLAKDKNSRYVLIELKRSKAASREAIHEVLKYIEGIKQNKSLKNDEIIAYIVSTEWEELIVPFSLLVKEAPFDVIGYKLEIDDALNPTSSVLIEPLSINNDRFLSDQHALCLYTTEANLKKGVDSHILCLQEKGIQDFVLLLLEAHSEYHEQEVQATAQGLQDIASQFDAKPSMTYEELIETMPKYQYMIYSSVQVMSNDKYWEILRKDNDLYEEVLSYTEDMEEDELILCLHENAVENCEPTPFKERYDIGYPAKLKYAILEVQCWEIVEVIRNGRLEKNSLLSDDIIIGELLGDGGTNKQTYSKKINSNNSASFEQIIKDVSKCLADNPIWLQGISKAITELKDLAKKQEFEGFIHVFNPSNTLISLYKAATSPSPLEAVRWVPAYLINIESGTNQRTYFGALVQNNEKASLQEVLEKAYDGTPKELLLSLNWGGYQENDIDITPIYGLEYTNYLCDITEGKKKYYCFDGFRYKVTNEIDCYSEVFEFMNNNASFVDEIVSLFKDATLTPGFVTL